MKLKRPPTPEPKWSSRPSDLSFPPTPEPNWRSRPSTPLRDLGSSPTPPATPERHALLRSPFSWLPTKGKKSTTGGEEGGRFLIMVYVVGSPGPLRMVIGGGESVGEVIRSALKLYSREGRLPVVGTDPAVFELHCANSGLGALDGKKELLSCGSRSFLLCKKANTTRAKRMEKSKTFSGKLSILKTITSRRLGALRFARSISFN